MVRLISHFILWPIPGHKWLWNFGKTFWDSVFFLCTTRICSRAFQEWALNVNCVVYWFWLPRKCVEKDYVYTLQERAHDGIEVSVWKQRVTTSILKYVSLWSKGCLQEIYKYISLSSIESPKAAEQLCMQKGRGLYFFKFCFWKT